MFIVTCPHCKLQIAIEAINCAIFRHGVLKSNGEQINPHASKETCDQLISSESIYGCGKPFKVIEDTSGELIAIYCDYI